MSEKDKLNLLALLEAIAKIAKFSAGYKNADAFYANERDFDASMMNFIIIGEMVVRLSDKFVKENTQVDWFRIRGFRNIIAHDYFGIDAEEVWQIIKIDLPKLENDLNAILKE